MMRTRRLPSALPLPADEPRASRARKALPLVGASLILLAACGRSSLLGGDCPPGTARLDGTEECRPLPDGFPVDLLDAGDMKDAGDMRDAGDMKDGGDGGDGGECVPKAEVCNNGIDDDCDKLIDCKDVNSCEFNPSCIVKEICDNKKDDDFNGLTDCKDPACFTDPKCFVPGLEICNNGVDDDNNGLVDCKDPACMALPLCKPHVCDQNNPNCADPVCVDHPACQNLVCKPTVNFGQLAKNDAKSTKTVNTTGTKDVAITPCAPGNAGMVVTEFEVLADNTSVKLEYTQGTGLDHVFGLFRAGVNQKCEANPITCFDPKGAPSGNRTFVLNKGRYYLIVQPFAAKAQGAVTVTLSTPPSMTPEVCNNGVDDDKNGLIDCADPSCFANMVCSTKQCSPDTNVGTLILTEPPTRRIANFNTAGKKNRYQTSCGGGGGDHVVQFTLKETVGVLMELSQTGDHIVELFKKPPAGQACDAVPAGCFDPNQSPNVSVAWGELPPGEYLFIFSAMPNAGGPINVALSAYRNRKIELCHNGFDDDSDGLADCNDPDCFSDPGCGPPVCQPTVDLGTLVVGAQPKNTSVNTVNGIPNLTVSCAKGGGKSRVVQVTLAEAAGLGVSCNDSTDHVLGYFAAQGTRDPCDKLELVCGDHKVIPFGCNYIIPNMQPGTYYVIAQAFQAGKEGNISLSLSAVDDRALEICNNGVDDDKDGFKDCADRKCGTSPYCVPKACKPDDTIDPMPTTGQAVFKLVQTAGKQVTASPPCQSMGGGGNSVIAVNLPQKATLTVGYAQLGQHVFAVYPFAGKGTICDAAMPLGCTASMGANNSGQVVFSNLPAGLYYFVAAANAPGDEGSVSLKFTAAP